MKLTLWEKIENAGMMEYLDASSTDSSMKQFKFPEGYFDTHDINITKFFGGEVKLVTEGEYSTIDIELEKPKEPEKREAWCCRLKRYGVVLRECSEDLYHHVLLNEKVQTYTMVFLHRTLIFLFVFAFLSELIFRQE